MDILGLGMSILDSVQIVESFPGQGGVTEVTTSVLMGGGPVATALCTASRLGASTAMIDRIGDDWRGDLIGQDFEKYGVDLRYLERVKGGRSAFAVILVRESDGERHIVFQRGDVPDLTSAELPDAALEACRILHLNGRHWPAALEAARRVKRAGGLVSFDGGAHRYDPKFRELFPLVDILIVASEFAASHAGSHDRESQLDALAGLGAEIVGITEGGDGSWFRVAGEDSFHQPAFPMPSLVDTTGCGDAFHGAFLAAASRGDSWRECARFASAAAALNATKLGGRGNLALRSEVEALLK